jgi:hypothetical protein
VFQIIPPSVSNYTLFQKSSKCGAMWRVWRSPHIRGSGLSGGVGGPHARENLATEVARPPHVVWHRSRCFSCLEWSVWVQQHCGVGSCMAVALSVWWCLPPRLLYQRRIISEVSILAFGRLWVQATVVPCLLRCRCK